jgi:hypothetical protein
MKRKISFESILTRFLVGLSFANLLLMVVFCFKNQTIALDEMVTLTIAKGSFKELLLKLAPLDFAPPLYHLYCKAVIQILTAVTPMTIITAGKLASVFPMIALVAVALTKVSKNWGRFCGGAFAFCVTAMPQMFFYGIQIRMYALAIFLVTMTFLFAFDTAKKPCAKNFILLAVFAVLGAYTHYYAVVAVAVIYLILGIWFFVHKQYKTLMPMFFSGFCVPALLAPWLVFDRKLLLMGMEESHLGSSNVLSNLPYHMTFPLRFEYGHITQNSKLFILLSVIYFIPLIAFMRYRIPFAVKAQNDQAGALLKKCKEIQKQLVFEKYFSIAGYAVVAGVILVGMITSIRQNTFVDRYLFPTLGCFWLGFDIALSHMNGSIHLGSEYVKPQKKRNAIVNALVLCGAILAVTLSVHNFLAFQIKQIKVYQNSPSPYAILQVEDVVVCDGFLTADYVSFFSDAKKIYYSQALPTAAEKLAFGIWYPNTEYIADYSVVNTLMQNSEKLVLMFHSGVVPDEVLYAAKANHYAIVEQKKYFTGKRMDSDFFAEDFTLFTCTKIQNTPSNS